MLLTFLTLLSALSISAVAIFYSIAGLAAIFAGAAVPIMIMGSVLEVGKLVTASWLYQNWTNAPKLIKYYLAIAVFVLMFITSMGIFGFLSKAHVEQTAPSSLIINKIEQIDDRISRENNKISRFKIDLQRLNAGEDVRVDSLVDSEQDKLQSIYERIDKEVASITSIANQSIQTQKDRIAQAKERADRDIKQIQERMKGAFSKSKFDKEIDQVRKNEVAVAASAQKEIISIQNKLNSDIQAIKDKYSSQITTINEKINELSTQANLKTGDIDVKIKQIEDKLVVSYSEVDSLTEEKFSLQTEIKKIEVEVGPIKYIAEFVYGETADKNMLEEAVRWVIIIIIFVFDPLAVLMLIAANYSLKQRYGKSIEDFAESRFNRNLDDQAGVEPDQYWKERYDEMKGQLDVFNALKDKENANGEISGVKPGREEQLKNFAEREKAEKQALEDYAKKHQEEEIVDPLYEDGLPEFLKEDSSREQQVKEQYWKQDIQKDELPDPDKSESNEDESKKKD